MQQLLRAVCDTRFNKTKVTTYLYTTESWFVQDLISPSPRHQRSYIYCVLRSQPPICLRPLTAVQTPGINNRRTAVRVRTTTPLSLDLGLLLPNY